VYMVNGEWCELCVYAVWCNGISGIVEHFNHCIWVM